MTLEQLHNGMHIERVIRKMDYWLKFENVESYIITNPKELNDMEDLGIPVMTIIKDAEEKIYKLIKESREKQVAELETV